MSLQIEYNCTDAELKEAQSLHEQDHRKGSKLWAYLFQGITVLLTVVAAFFRFKRDVAPEDRVWYAVLLVALTVLCYVIITKFHRATRRKQDQVSRVTVSDHGLVFDSDTGHGEIPWSVFSKCMESPGLFVLVDSTKVILYVIPKRAFPDVPSQDWFRTLATQPRAALSVSEIPADPPTLSPAANGIRLALNYKYRDYLNRNWVSWRMKGMTIVVMLMFVVITIVTAANPPPNAVNPPSKVVMIAIPMICVMMTVVTVAISLISWMSERKFLKAEHILVNGDGIEFLSQSRSRLSWATYKYYLENRWSFFVWNPEGAQWLMFPKREFASRSDLMLFRDHLHQNLKPSRWFYL